MDARRIDKAILIGHSMGGKTIMDFAFGCPERILSLISVDIAPRDYNDLALDSHGAADHEKMIDAMLELDLSRFESREEADIALRPSIGSERVRSFLLKNLRREKDGTFYWRINLEAIRANLDKIMDTLPDIERVIAEGGITGFPTLFISGASSDYIRAEDHQLIKSVFPMADIVTIPGAGHWLHAEQPALLVKNILYFLDV